MNPISTVRVLRIRYVSPNLSKERLLKPDSLQSPANYICTIGQFLSQQESPNNMILSSNEYSDEIARNGFSHYSPLENLFIVSDKQYGIAGLWQPPGKTAPSCSTSFSSTILTSIQLRQTQHWLPNHSLRHGNNFLYLPPSRGLSPPPLARK